MHTVIKFCLSRFAILFASVILSVNFAALAETADGPIYSRSMHEYKIPNIKVTTQDGKKTMLQDVLEQDQPVMVNFIFTSCNAICPVMTAIFSKVQAAIGATSPNLKLVSISIDPEHDTPAMLMQYANKFKAGNNWLFLTGELADIQLVQTAFDAYRGDKMNHALLTLIHAPGTHSWLRIEGAASANELTNEYNSLVSQATIDPKGEKISD